jgi:hypothetical protein
MTINRYILTAALGLVALGTSAGNLAGDLRVKGRLGYNIGGTAPIGLPASIRGLNSYTMQPNLSLGLDAVKPLQGRWGVLLGLRFEGKGMKEDAQVKNYHEEIVRGGEKLEGRFTGDVTTHVRQWMLTLPLQATWAATPQLDLRVGDPTGTKVILGDDAGTRGNYDFPDDMRPLQWGVTWEQTGMAVSASASSSTSTGASAAYTRAVSRP